MKETSGILQRWVSANSKNTFKLYTCSWNRGDKILATGDTLNNKNNNKYQNYLKLINILKFNGINFLAGQEETFRK